MIRHLIFDLDGTLIDSQDDIRDSLFAAYNAVGLRHRLPDDLRIGPPLAEMVQTYTPNLPANTVATITAGFRKIYDNCGFTRTRLYPGVSFVLSKLVAFGRSLYIATNKPSLATERVLKQLNIESLFTATIHVDTTPNRQAGKTGMVAHLLSRFQLDPHATWVVGDSAQDIEAAHANGLRAVAVLTGYDRPESIRAACPDFCLDTIEELIALPELGLIEDDQRVHR